MEKFLANDSKRHALLALQEELQRKKRSGAAPPVLRAPSLSPGPSTTRACSSRSPGVAVRPSTKKEPEVPQGQQLEDDHPRPHCQRGRGSVRYVTLAEPREVRHVNGEGPPGRSTAAGSTARESSRPQHRGGVNGEGGGGNAGLRLRSASTVRHKEGVDSAPRGTQRRRAGRHSRGGEQCDETTRWPEDRLESPPR